MGKKLFAINMFLLFTRRLCDLISVVLYNSPGCYYYYFLILHIISHGSFLILSYPRATLREALRYLWMFLKRAHFVSGNRHKGETMDGRGLLTVVFAPSPSLILLLQISAANIPPPSPCPIALLQVLLIICLRSHLIFSSSVKGLGMQFEQMLPFT